MINAICLFRKGIAPAWEDGHNAKGSEFRVLLENFYDKDKENNGGFTKTPDGNDMNNANRIDEFWEQLVFRLISEDFIDSEYITGVRILDKSFRPRHPNSAGY